MRRNSRSQSWNECSIATNPIATPPVLCWLCGAVFLSWEAFYRHCRLAHCDLAEYRKHRFWFDLQREFLSLLPWQKRHMLGDSHFSNVTQFQRAQDILLDSKIARHWIFVVLAWVTWTQRCGAAWNASTIFAAKRKRLPCHFQRLRIFSG